MTTASVSSSVMLPQGRGGHVAIIGDGQGTTSAFNKGNTPSFSDLIDTINPLQHIPVVNAIYRAVTGDHESAFADVVGGAIYGGPLGAGLAVADLGLKDATGKDAGEMAMSWLGVGGDDKAKDGETAVAKASQPAAQVAAATTGQPKTLTTSSAVKPTPLPTKKTLAQGTALGTAQATPSNTASANPTLKPASLTTASVAQPAATMGTETPAIVPAGSPYAAPTAAAASAQNGPMTMGDYLVFGGSGGAAGQSAAAGTGAATVQVASAAPASASKSFATFGTGAQPAPILPPAPDTVPGTSAAATPASIHVASAANATTKMFPVPPRNGPAKPTAVLPPPTTGPGAIPGGKSMALSAQAEETAVQQDPQHNFLSAYTQALDKYRSAQRLAAQNSDPANGVAADGSAPTALLQPASAVAPVDPTAGGSSSIVLH
ncbi:MAG TPA: hypothetical protein VGG27_15380 [Magnetospirillaceae bacterium]|jgi:hypothetical protein